MSMKTVKALQICLLLAVNIGIFAMAHAEYQKHGEAQKIAKDLNTGNAVERMGCKQRSLL